MASVRTPTWNESLMVFYGKSGRFIKDDVKAIESIVANTERLALLQNLMDENSEVTNINMRNTELSINMFAWMITHLSNFARDYLARDDKAKTILDVDDVLELWISLLPRMEPRDMHATCLDS
jgi:hypothetical protein